MIGGDAATRIMTEVSRGVLVSLADTYEERDYRERIKMSFNQIRLAGGIVDMPKEWPAVVVGGGPQMRDYAQTQYPLLYEQIGKNLDALEQTSKVELSAELRRIRSDLAARLKTATSPRAFRLLPRRAELDAVVQAMLQRAWEAGQVEMLREVRGRQYASTSFTPKAATKWMKDAAFWVTDVLSDGLLSDAQTILVKGLKNGTPTSTMMVQLFEAFVPYLGGDVGEQVITAYRLETIVRTNTTTAYNHGRLTTALDPDLILFLDGIRYNAILDTRTTEVCRFLDQKVFRMPAQGDDVEALLPPRHFNCRSIITPVVAGEQIDPDTVITAAEVTRAKELSGTGFMSKGAFKRYAE